jgi:predicted kinase
MVQVTAVEVRHRDERDMITEIRQVSGWGVTSPTLVVVSGPSGSGKTTLAHAIASGLGCPAICRDEIKQGMVHATPGFTPGPGDPLSLRTLGVFFDVLGLLLRAGATVVAEAAFQDRLWRPGLEPLTGLADLRIIRCTVDAGIAHARIARRVGEDAHRAAHDDVGLLQDLQAGTAWLDAFVPISLAAPTLRVDTTDGYEPALPKILSFVERDRAR